MVLGHEAVGEVLATGGPLRYWSSDRVVAAGDRVTWSVAASCGACVPCARGIPQKCDALSKYGHTTLEQGGPFCGGMAELSLLPSGTAVLPVPNTVHDTVAAPANCATATAAAALRVAGELEGRLIKVQGADLLGLTACAMAHDRGARVLVAEPHPRRRASATRWGAADVTNPTDPEHVARLRTFTQGRGFDVVIEASGAHRALAQGLDALAVGGSYILLGTVSPTAAWALDAEHLVRRLLRIQGVHNYTPDDLAVALEFLERCGDRYPLAEVVGGHYSLDDHAAALAAARTGDALRVAFRPHP